MSKYDFRRANLRGACLMDGDFTGCDFTNASIIRIALRNCKISFKQLAATSNYKRRELRYMSFVNVQFADSVDLAGVNLTGTTFRLFGGQKFDATFNDAVINKCFFEAAITRDQLCSTKNYKSGNLSGVKLWRVDMSQSDLSYQNLTNGEFLTCDFTGANFDHAIINGCRFVETTGRDSCTGLTLDQIKSTWNYRKKRMAGVVLPKELADALLAEKR